MIGYLPPTEHRIGPVELSVSNAGYGWSVRFGRRVAWSSTRATTRMLPRIMIGGDENCNRSVTIVLWPLGHLDVWWEPSWRTEPCGECAPYLDDWIHVHHGRDGREANG